MKVKVYTSEGTSSKEQELNSVPVFEGNKGIRALRDTLLAYQANARQGNASTKTRGNVRGGGKKPWRQKGTGMARSGSRRSPIWVGGGVAFGPLPRDYSQKVNRKAKNLAFKRALFERFEEGAIAVIEAFSFEKPSTKAFLELIANIYSAGDSEVLVIDETFEQNTALSGRNLPNAHFCEAQSLNAWDLMSCNKILITQKGLDQVLARVNAEA